LGKKIIWTVVVAVLLVSMYFLGFLRPVESVVTGAINPVMSGLYTWSSEIRGKYQAREDKEWLNQRIDELEEQVNRLTAENAELSTVHEENQVLRKHLDFLEEKEHNYVMANVVSRGEISGDSKRTETIVIDKGRANGLQEGLVVLTEEGVVAGKIMEAKERTSQVYLVNNENCRLASTIMGEDKTSGIIKGELGLTIKMKFIPQTQSVQAGDKVTTSGLESLIPRGLAIGKVVKVKRESNELWQTATIEPLVDTEDLIIVSVLKSE